MYEYNYTCCYYFLKPCTRNYSQSCVINKDALTNQNQASNNAQVEL